MQMGQLCARAGKQIAPLIAAFSEDASGTPGWSVLADKRNSLLADIKPVITVSDAGQRSQAVSPALASARYLSPRLEKRR